MTTQRMRERRLRVLRAGAAVVVAVILAAAAHTLAGGGPPPPWLLGAVVVLALPAAVAVVGQRPAVWRTALIVAGAQVLLHSAFATVGSADPLAAVPHVHGALDPAGILGLDSAGADGGIATSAAMAAGHVAAAAVTTIVLQYGERAAHAVARGLVRLSALASPRLPVIVRPATLTARASRSRLTLASFLSVAPRRGPPVALAR